MTLRRKAWYIVGGSLLLLSLGLIGVVEQVIGGSFEALEIREAERHATRTVALLDRQLTSLERGTRDYASWTDTYTHLVGYDPAYLETNLSVTNLTNLGLDAFFLFRPDGGFHSGRLLAAGEDDAAPAEEPAVARDFARQAEHVAASGEGRSGLLRLSTGELVMAACLPVLRNDYSGPPAGAAVQLRRLDDAYLAETASLLQLDLKLSPEPFAPSMDGIALADGELTLLSNDRLQVTLPLRDVEGAALGRLVFENTRDVFGRWREARRWFNVALLLVVAVAACAMVWLLGTQVLNRVARLGNQLAEIRDEDGLSGRVVVEQRDELSDLAVGINGMLGRLQEARHQREQLNNQLAQAQRLEALGTLTGGLAHDFNNLLAGIRGSVALMRMDPALSPALGEHLNRIDAVSAHGANIVRQMMSFSRHDPAAFTAVRLGGVVRQAADFLRVALGGCIVMEVREQAADDWVRADETQLQQVLINLGNNAAHAMGGAGRLTFTLAEVSLPDAARVETSGLKPGRYLRLHVVDTGPGIPVAEQTKIFLPFYTTKPPGSGSGLGLSVVHGIMQAHGGSIAVESPAGQGAHFILHFPAAASSTPRVSGATMHGGGPDVPSVVVKAPAQSGPGRSPGGFEDKAADSAVGSEPPVKATDSVQVGAVDAAVGGTGARGRGERVLLVEDEAMVRDTLRSILQAYGYRVTVAADGMEGWERLQGEPRGFDLLLTDQRMPRMDGLELGRKAANLRPDLPKILHTGFGGAVSAEQLRACGFCELVLKPVVLEELLQIVRDTLDRAGGGLRA